eukprot:gene10221-11907_t
MPSPTPPLTIVQLKDNSGRLHWCKDFLNQRMAANQFKKRYGRAVPLPRLLSWMAADGAHPYLADKQNQSQWTEPMLQVKHSLEHLLNVSFDYVLVNYYRDGKDYIGWHSDREAKDEQCRVIASLSLGTTRRFLLRHIKSSEQMEYQLTPGKSRAASNTSEPPTSPPSPLSPTAPQQDRASISELAKTGITPIF